MRTLKNWMDEYGIDPEEYEYPEGYFVQRNCSNWDGITLDINNLHCRQLSLSMDMPWKVDAETSNILAYLHNSETPVECPYEGTPSPRAALQHIDRVLDKAIAMNIENCIAWREDNKVYVVNADLSSAKAQGDQQ